MELGYWLSSEEHQPDALVAHACAAEDAGFATAMISDHFHPWLTTQGASPFVWTVLGALAHATSRMRIGTGVSAPIRRIHPAVLAHASATVALMMPGRFFLGLGTGERLNEQVVGRRWPRPAERRAMVEEAVEIVRALWDGGVVNHDGRHFRVEGARLFTRPDLPPPIMVAANGSTSARLAGSIGDGLVGVSPDARMVEAFEFAGGAGKPRLGQVHACWAASEKEARETALHWWPNAAFPPDALTELARPAQLDELRALVTEDAVAGAVACGPDPERHVEAIARFVGAGFTEVYVHQVGPDQLGFIDFYRREVMPRLQ